MRHNQKKAIILVLLGLILVSGHIFVHKFLIIEGSVLSEYAKDVDRISLEKNEVMQFPPGDYYVRLKCKKADLKEYIPQIKVQDGNVYEPFSSKDKGSDVIYNFHILAQTRHDQDLVKFEFVLPGVSSYELKLRNYKTILKDNKFINLKTHDSKNYWARAKKPLEGNFNLSETVLV